MNEELVKCPACDGAGDLNFGSYDQQTGPWEKNPCSVCNGTGKTTIHEGVKYLRERRGFDARDSAMQGCCFGMSLAMVAFIVFLLLNNAMGKDRAFQFVGVAIVGAIAGGAIGWLVGHGHASHREKVFRQRI